MAHLLASPDQHLLIHSALCPTMSRCTTVSCSRQQAGKSIQSGTMRSASSFTRRMGFMLKSKRHARSWPPTERQKGSLKTGGFGGGDNLLQKVNRVDAG